MVCYLAGLRLSAAMGKIHDPPNWKVTEKSNSMQVAIATYHRKGSCPESATLAVFRYD
jgi:hypothetical protein